MTNVNTVSKMTCMCDFCERHADMVADGVPQRIIDTLEHTEMELEYYKSIFEGSWPSGKELLENALKLYKE